MTAKEHYDTHLAKVYSWMVGDFSENMAKQLNFFQKHTIIPGGNHIAFDLGAGNGIQAVALAKLGFKVHAVDFNKQLLAELAANKQTLAIDIFYQNIPDFLNRSQNKAELITCMGDTLTHFNNREEVNLIVSEIAEKLTGNGKVVFSFRDLTDERKGDDRFLHVRSDDRRSMICFLEYFDEYVMVHDIILENEASEWIQKVSSYPKLKISADSFKNTLQQNQIAIVHEEMIRGMTFLIGEKLTQ